MTLRGLSSYVIRTNCKRLKIDIHSERLKQNCLGSIAQICNCIYSFLQQDVKFQESSNEQRQIQRLNLIENMVARRLNLPLTAGPKSGQRRRVAVGLWWPA